MMLFRESNKEISIGYKDDAGNLQKEYIQNILSKLGIDNSKETKELQKLGGNYLNWMKMANILFKLLDENWDILKLNFDLFFKK